MHMESSSGSSGVERLRKTRKEQSSPYSAAFTGCGFMLDETVALLPALQSPDADGLLRAEVETNHLLQLGKSKTRLRMITEFKRRYAAMPPSFWKWFLTLDRAGQTIALYYCLMRTYLLVKDVHLNVFLPCLKSANPTVVKADVERHICQIAAMDDFVASWSDETKGKIAGSCLSFLRNVGMLNGDDELKPVFVPDGLAAHFMSRGESWYLESLGMPLYEINRIKKGL